MKRTMPTMDEALFYFRLALRIRSARKKLGMTQSELAANLGVSQGRITKYETGRGMPRVIDLPLLCRALNTDPSTLLEFNE